MNLKTVFILSIYDKHRPKKIVNMKGLVGMAIRKWERLKKLCSEADKAVNIKQINNHRFEDAVT